MDFDINNISLPTYDDDKKDEESLLINDDNKSNNEYRSKLDNLLE
eukprot:CAMPEP_0114686888 /NCGR_PEP_ID=MMETSP0191-20121206/61952_1 /TAXON_ID=126664 /ORGANISM="Sorites sp." /LENGTH=44 /DNA_ID= /DNA_START= /DNA_END= /DNA_ORIENTATION=